MAKYGKSIWISIREGNDGLTENNWIIIGIADMKSAAVLEKVFTTTLKDLKQEINSDINGFYNNWEV